MRHTGQAMPAIPDSTKDSLTLRLLAHAEQHWPQLKRVDVTYRGTFGYVTGVLPDGENPRHVPLGVNTAALLNAYFAEHGLDRPGHDDHPLFANQHGSKLSRGGIAWIRSEERRVG